MLNDKAILLSTLGLRRHPPGGNAEMGTTVDVTGQYGGIDRAEDFVNETGHQKVRTINVEVEGEYESEETTVCKPRGFIGDGICYG